MQSLKFQLKELKTENSKLKSQLKLQEFNTRSCTLLELKSENKSFKKECKRLRLLLHEAMLQLSTSLTPLDVKEKYLALSIKIKALKKENKKLAQAADLPMPTESGKKKGVTARMKAKIQQLSQENEYLQEELQTLESKSNGLKAKLRDLEHLEAVPISNIIGQIYTAGNLRKLGVKDIWFFISDGNCLLYTSPSPRDS